MYFFETESYTDHGHIVLNLTPELHAQPSLMLQRPQHVGLMSHQGQPRRGRAGAHHRHPGLTSEPTNLTEDPGMAVPRPFGNKLGNMWVWQ